MGGEPGLVNSQQRTEAASLAERWGRLGGTGRILLGAEEIGTEVAESKASLV